MAMISDNYDKYILKTLQSIDRSLQIIASDVEFRQKAHINQLKKESDDLRISSVFNEKEKSNNLKLQITELTNALKEANAIALERSKEIHALRKKLYEAGIEE